METAIAATPLLAWSEAQLAQVAAMIEQAAAAWRSAWLPRDAGAARMTCGAAHELDAAARAPWALIGLEAGARAWLRGADSSARMMRELFGVDPRAGDAPVAHAVAGRAQSALLQDLVRAARLSPAAASGSAGADLFARWSGAVIVTSVDTPAFELLLDGECVRRLVTTSVQAASLPAAQPLAEALADRKLPLRVELAGIELSLGTLAALRIGDVIPLPHGLDEPLHVTTGGAPVCAAWLGRRHGHRAIELARPHTEPSPKEAKAA
jgi:flagellar motor switch/type III secretory pathway protein FliN